MFQALAFSLFSRQLLFQKSHDRRFLGVEMTRSGFQFGFRALTESVKGRSAQISIENFRMDVIFKIMLLEELRTLL